MALALVVDLQLAVANSPEGEGEEGLRRQLWLGIAQHVVQVCRRGGVGRGFREGLGAFGLAAGPHV